MKHAYKILFSLLLASSSIFAAHKANHHYTYRHFTTYDGLAQMQVMTAFQDSDGYIWFGTKGGISRWDGISFKNFTHTDGLPMGDPIEINQVGGKILFIFISRIAVLSPDGNIKIIELPENRRFLNFSGSFNNVSFPLDDDRIVLFNLFEKEVNQHSIPHVLQYSVRTESFTPYQCPEIQPELLINLRNDTLLSSKGIYKVDHENHRFQKVIPVPFEAGMMYITDQQRKNFFFDAPGQVSHYQLNGSEWKFIEKIENSKTDYFTKSNTLNDGTYIFHSGNKINTYPERKTSFGISLPYINGFFQDNENNLWVLTEHGVYNYFNLGIEEWSFGLGDKDAVWSVLQDDEKNMWFGSFGAGLWRMDTRGNLAQMGQNNAGWHLQYMNSFKNKAGTLFFPYGRGMMIYKNNQFSTSNSGDANLAGYFDEETQTLYQGGLNSDGKRGIRAVSQNQKQFYPWDFNHLICVEKDAAGRLRFGSFSGTSVLADGSLVPDTAGRAYKGVVSMSLDGSGRLWKGTMDGLYVELKDGTEHRVAPVQLNEAVFSMKVWRDKYVVLGNTSLYIIDIENLTDYANPVVLKIGHNGGFTGFETGQNGLYEDHSGDMWLTTAANVIKFNPEKLVQSHNQVIPKIRVSGMYHSPDNAGWKREIFDVKNPHRIELKASEKFLKIEYIANSISAPDALRFKYRLKGLSDEWSQAVKTKTAEFTNLNSGKYQLEVQCSLDGVHWSPVASSPVIHILAPLLLRWYMIVLYLLLFAAMIIGSSVFLLKRSQRKKTELLTLQKLENELQLRTLHSKVLPHFTKNVLTAIARFAMDDNRKAGHFISVFAKFLQQTLTNSDKNYTTVENELNYIQTYLSLEKMRFDNRMEYSVSVDENVDTSTLIPAMALHTYCDNAIRHGLVNKKGVGELEISIMKKPDGISIRVKDNGIGRKHASKLGTHGNQMGLKLIQQQLELYNRLNANPIVQKITDLEDETDTASGTQIELFIPDGYKFFF